MNRVPLVLCVIAAIAVGAWGLYDFGGWREVTAGLIGGMVALVLYGVLPRLLVRLWRSSR